MTTSTESAIRADSFTQGLLARLPDDYEEDFSDEQLIALKEALSSRAWNDHPIDFRKSIGLIKWRYYFVFIAGRDIRRSRVSDRPAVKAVEKLFLALFIIFITIMGIFVVYIIKSALGINLIPGFSFGVWDWFQALFR